MKKKKLVVLGSGALGTIIAETVCQKLSKNYEILGIFSETQEESLELSKKINCKTYSSLDQAILDKPDYLIEAAGSDVVKDIAIKVLENGINLIPLSVGAFADKDFYKAIKEKAIENNVRIHIPSGAVGGFDVLRGAMLIEDVDVSITTEKSPESLEGVPFLKGRRLSRDNEELVFKGSASQAIKHFPENVNVAVATALSTIGVDKTEVIIKSIPKTASNKHRIESIGETIKINLEIESTPSKENPKSSELAAYSVIALLENLASPISFN